MSLSGGRNTLRSLRSLAHFLVVSAALVSGLKPAVAQSTDPPNE
jgi:hypothetical protein